MSSDIIAIAEDMQELSARISALELEREDCECVLEDDDLLVEIRRLRIDRDQLQAKYDRISGVDDCRPRGGCTAACL